jgi:hypothetical protein
MDVQPDEQVVSDSFLMLPMMGARLGWLDQSWPVFAQTGLPLIGERNGLLAPVPVGDDIGFYILAPVAARALGLSLHNAISLLLVAFAAAGALLAIIQLWAAFTDWPTRLYTAAAVGATTVLILFAAGDVYAIAAAGVFALLPICVGIGRRRSPIGLGWLPAAVLVGGAAEALNLIRSHAASGPLIAIALVLLAHRATAFRTRLLLVAGIAIGAVGVAYLGTMPVAARDAYLEAHRSDYQPIIAVHPFWHSVYIGLGFLSNPLGLAYKDDVAHEAANRINPALADPITEEWKYDYVAHERAVRQATLDFIAAHTFFAVKSVFAKLGVVTLFLLIFGNVGLLGTRRLAASPSLMIPLGLAMAAAAMPGVLVVPNFNYLSAFVAAATVTAAVGLGLFRDRPMASRAAAC